MLTGEKRELIGPVSQAVVARKCGVSRTTVAFAFNEHLSGKVRAETRQRILTTAKQMGYQPNRAAKALRSGRFQAVGLVIGDVMNMFYASFVRAFEELLEARGYDLVVEDTQVSPEREKICLEKIVARQVDGIFCFVGDKSLHTEYYRRQWVARKPVTVIGPCPDDLLVDAVVGDYSRGMGQAVDHLVELGHRRVAFVSGLGTTQSDEGRVRLLQEGLRRHGLGFPENYLIQCGHTLEDGRRKFGEFLARTPRSDWPTAVIAINDVIAIGLMRASLDHGLRVPEQLSVIGVDNTPLAEHLPIPLTSINCQYVEMAGQAVKFLFERVRGDSWPPPRRRTFESGLVVRSSTAMAGA